MRLWAHASPSALKRAEDLELNSATGFVMPCHHRPDGAAGMRDGISARSQARLTARLRQRLRQTFSSLEPPQMPQKLILLGRRASEHDATFLQHTGLVDDA